MLVIRSILLIFLVTIFCKGGFEAFAQGCANGLMLQPGTRLEYHSYKGKKKRPQYSTRHHVITMEKLPDRVLGHLKCVFYDKDNEVERSFDYFIGCKDGKMILDKEVLSDPDNIALFQDKEFSFDGKNIHYPDSALPGDTLRTANFTVQVSTGSVKLARISTTITNRKVEAIMPVTTPAGTFSCYKISYTSELSRGSSALSFITRKKLVEYVVPGLGVVRSEVLNKKGKVKSYTQLVELQQPAIAVP